MSGVGAVSSSHVDDDDSDTQRGDYQDYRPHVTRFKRYLVHDCCEFGNAESLRQLIFVRKDDSDESSSDSSSYASSSDAIGGAIEGGVPLLERDGAKVSLNLSHEILVPQTNNNDASCNILVTTDQKDSGPSIDIHESDKEVGPLDEQQQASSCGQTPMNKEVTSESVMDTKNTNKEENNESNNEQKVEIPEPQAESNETKTQNELESMEPKPISKEISPSSPIPSSHASDILDAIGLSQEETAASPGKPLTTEIRTEEESEKKIEYYCPYDLDERDEDENTPLHIAIHSHKLESVRLLLQAGANVHKKSDGSSPVHLAVSLGAIPQHSTFAADCLSLLREYDADLSMKDESMHTPLYLACMVNAPKCAAVILKDINGITTLNLRADRTGGRPLHACAKFDKSGMSRTKRPPSVSLQEEAILTRLLLATPGIEIDSLNNYGRTPLHIAAMYSNWPVARYLLQSGANPKSLDRRSQTPWSLANKRGFVIPTDLLPLLSPSCISSPTRDLIMDPNSKTILLHHELCNRHRSCPPIVRSGTGEPPPENIRRLHVLIQEGVGILRGREFMDCVWEMKARRADISDVLKVHEYQYVEKINQVCSSIPDHSTAIASLDPDTTVSRWSFEAALHAAGSVCEAVDKIMAGDYRNAFCAVRPPGHHAGPRGIVSCPNDPDGSHGFCLLNNVAIGAAYARSMYRNDGIKKVAIIDFDVHHGNGTEEIIRNLIPFVDTAQIRTPFAVGTLQTPKYRPWLNEQDIQDVFFASTHGYGPRERHVSEDEPTTGGWFYPASGRTMTSESISDPNFVDRLSINNFLSTQTWARMGSSHDTSRTNCCKIINVGLSLPRGQDIPGMQRIEVRDSYRLNILPHLLEFNPDLIFISAGFDGHKKDSMNFGYCGLIEDDYEWITEQIIKVANTTCNGRIVSVLEGGYKIHGGIVSPFARSVASHVRALQDGGSSREVFTKEDAEWESRLEHGMVEEKERRRQSKLEKLKFYQNAEAERSLRTRTVPQVKVIEETKTESSMSLSMETSAPIPDHPITDIQGILQEPLLHDATAPMLGVTNQEEEEDDPQQLSRKRRRNQVDYKQLFEQMKKESSFTG